VLSQLSCRFEIIQQAIIEEEAGKDNWNPPIRSSNSDFSEHGLRLSMIGCRDAIHGTAHVLERHYQVQLTGTCQKVKIHNPWKSWDEIHRSRVSAVRLQGFARLLISWCRMKSARKNLFGAASSWHSGVAACPRSNFVICKAPQ
jgi:hypothetical protein